MTTDDERTLMEAIEADSYRRGWLDALDAVLQLLADVERGLRSEEEVRPELDRARLRLIRSPEPQNPSVPASAP